MILSIMVDLEIGADAIGVRRVVVVRIAIVVDIGEIRRNNNTQNLPHRNCSMLQLDYLFVVLYLIF